MRRARKHHALTLDELAKRVGVSKGLLSQYEKGTTMPSLSTLQRLASALTMTLDAIVNGPGARGMVQATMPGMSLDDRIAALPDALREFVLQALQLAESARGKIPEQFLTPPTSENLAQFHEYLRSITMHEPKGKP